MTPIIKRAVATAAHGDAAAGSSSKLCYIFVFLLVVLLALLLKQVWIMAEILYSALERKAVLSRIESSRF